MRLSHQQLQPNRLLKTGLSPVNLDSKLQKLHGWSEFEDLYHFLPQRLYKEDLIKLGNVTGNHFQDTEWDDFLRKYGTIDERKRFYCSKYNLRATSGLSREAYLKIVKILKENYESVDAALASLRPNPGYSLQRLFPELENEFDLTELLTEYDFKVLFANIWLEKSKVRFKRQQKTYTPDLKSPKAVPWTVAVKSPTAVKSPQVQASYLIDSFQRFNKLDLNSWWLFSGLDIEDMDDLFYRLDKDCDGIVTAKEVRTFLAHEVKPVRKWKMCNARVKLGHRHCQLHFDALLNSTRAIFIQIQKTLLDVHSSKLRQQLSELPKYIPITKFLQTLDKYYDINTITQHQRTSIVAAFRRQFDYNGYICSSKIVELFSAVNSESLQQSESLPQFKKFRSESKLRLNRSPKSAKQFHDYLTVQLPKVSTEARHETPKGLTTDDNRTPIDKMIDYEKMTGYEKLFTTLATDRQEFYRYTPTAQNLKGGKVYRKLKSIWSKLIVLLKMHDIGQTGIIDMQNFLLSLLRVQIQLNRKEFEFLSKRFGESCSKFNFFKLGVWLSRPQIRHRSSSIQDGIVGATLTPREKLGSPRMPKSPLSLVKRKVINIKRTNN